MRNSPIVFTVAGLSLIAAGCSSAPAPPQPGTPAFYWGAARSTYGTGDYLKANDNLAQILKGQNEFAARSVPWALVLSAGIAQGYMQLADNFEDGARANRANPTPFRRQSQLFRTNASAAALLTAETLHRFLASDAAKAETVALEFEYPTGSLTEPVQMQRVTKGMLFPEAEIESMQKAMLQRGVVTMVTRAAGAGDDAAKTLEIFKKGDVKVSRAVFLLAMAKALHDQADLFCARKLDQPQRIKMVCGEAEEALKTIPATKETKELLGKIAKTKKAAKIT